MVELHTLTVVGAVAIWVQQGDAISKLKCKLIDSTNIHPLLESILHNIISYLDNDAFHKLNTGNWQVYALDVTTAITKEQLIR